MLKYNVDLHVDGRFCFCPVLLGVFMTEVLISGNKFS